MKIWNQCICLTNKKTIMVVIAVILFSTLVLASVWPDDVVEVVEEGSENTEEMWIPLKKRIRARRSSRMVSPVSAVFSAFHCAVSSLFNLMYNFIRLPFVTGLNL